MIEKTEALTDIQYNRAIQAYHQIEYRKCEIKKIKEQVSNRDDIEDVINCANLEIELGGLSHVQFDIQMLSSGMIKTEECAKKVRIKYGSEWYTCWRSLHNDYIDDQLLLERAFAYELIYGDASIIDI
ncbi:MAG: hypothetical protein Q4G60_07200 [bacterium]|nr:hypothetical protein [bacterium]